MAPGYPGIISIGFVLTWIYVLSNMGFLCIDGCKAPDNRVDLITNELIRSKPNKFPTNAYFDGASLDLYEVAKTLIE